MIGCQFEKNNNNLRVVKYNIGNTVDYIVIIVMSGGHQTYRGDHLIRYVND